MGYLHIPFDILNSLAREIFVSYGYSEKDAETIADVLLTADLFGIESHGVQRLSLYPYGIRIGRIKVNADMRAVKETPVSLLLDADAGMGQIAGKAAMLAAIKKAERHGFGIVSVRNSNHYGIAGYYSLMAAKKGMIGVSMTNTQALVVPTFGIKPMLGTDPIAFSAPAEPYPFHLDMSTSVVTGGKMEVYAKEDKPLPEGWAVDETGRVNTSARRFVENRGKGRGGILPLGGAGELLSGYKGYGLAMMVEIMTGILSGGVASAFVREKNDKELCSHVFMAIDPSLFSDDASDFERRLSDFLNTIRNGEKADGYGRIYIHGEKEFERQAEVLKNGVPVANKTWEEITQVCDERGIDIKTFGL